MTVSRPTTCFDSGCGVQIPRIAKINHRKAPTASMRVVCSGSGLRGMSLFSP